MSAAERASLALRGRVGLGPERVGEIIRQSCSQVKGGGASLLTTGAQNIGAQINIERDAENLLELSITSGKRIVELCTFTARFTAGGEATSVIIGGLDTYKTTQSLLLGFIPVGPKMIAGMAPYKRFLAVVKDGLLQADPVATVTIG